LNPLPFLKVVEQKEQGLYYENDPHLNIHGQKVLAAFLNKELL